MTATVAGPDGALPVDQLSGATLIASGAKAHTCAACGSAIPIGDPSMAAQGVGRTWRLCPDCAPGTLAGYPIAWGRTCAWRAREVRTVEPQERRENQGDEDFVFGGYVAPWDGSGWDKPPVTPEDREATERHEQAHRDAFCEARDERYRQRATESAAAAAARREHSCQLIEIVCGLAAKYAAGAHEHSRESLETAAKLIIPEIVRSFDPDPRRHDLSIETASALVIYVCWESARKGYEAGHRAGQSRTSPPAQ